MAKQKIITLSGKARHGKDLSCNIIKKILQEKGKRVLMINYADFLKYLASEYLNWNGRKDEKGRTILQELGNEKVEKFPCFWVDTVINITKLFEDDYDYVLIGDCRFPHDINRWKEEGYDIFPIHVERLNYDNGLTKEQKNHPTEVALNDFKFMVNIKARSLNELESEIKRHVINLIT